jgi:hypothetical protein
MTCIDVEQIGHKGQNVLVNGIELCSANWVAVKYVRHCTSHHVTALHSTAQHTTEQPTTGMQSKTYELNISHSVQ